MSLYVVDVESDGPIPGDYSMIALGAVRVDEQLTTTFGGRLHPISDKFVPEALAVSGFSREDTLNFDDPQKVMREFDQWISETNQKNRPVLISDNNGFDAMFVSWYFWHFLQRNPFGHSSRRIGDLYAGLRKDFSAQSSWKELRRTKHTHAPVDDARGNAEALIDLARTYHLRDVY